MPLQFERILVSGAVLVVGIWLGGAPLAKAQPAAESADSFRDGRSFMPTKVYTAEDDERVLKLYGGLRVADVSDGMDQAGLANRGLVSAEIGPLWRDTEHFTHRMVGIAVTARYVPTNRPRQGPIDADEFNDWVGNWYDSVSPEPFVPLLRAGSVLVIDDAAKADVGSIGSNNIMSWKARGCVGSSPAPRRATRTKSSPRRYPCIFGASAAASGRDGMRSNR